MTVIMKKNATGNTTRLSSASRQSSTNKYTMVSTGAAMFAVISGNRCARVVSMPSTWSTMVCFSLPLEVSITVPRGSLGSLASSICRMVLRML